MNVPVCPYVQCESKKKQVTTIFSITSKLYTHRTCNELTFLPAPRRLCFHRRLSVCLLVSLRKIFQTDLHESFREGWQWANEQMIKFWWQSASLSGYRDCFPDSSLLGDTESDIDRLQLRCARLQSRDALAGIAVATMTSLRHRPLAGVCIVPVILVTSLSVGVRSIAMSMSVCLPVRSHISRTTCPNFAKFSLDCHTPWLSPVLTTVQYVMYFRFCS